MGASAALELNSRSRPKVVLSISKDDLIHENDRYSDFEKNYDRYYIWTMSYNSLRDELFFVDYANSSTVRSTSLRDDQRETVNVFEFDDRYLYGEVTSVCYISDSDTLVLTTSKSNHLVVLTRIGEGRGSYEWRKADGHLIGSICCAVSDSRLLIGNSKDSYMELFRVESGPRVTLLHRINVPKIYYNFSVSGSGEELVAVSYKNSVCVNRLCHNRLEEISRIQLRSCNLLWLGDRLLATERIHSQFVVELEVRGTRLERRRELLDLKYARIDFNCWCAVDNEFALYDGNMNALVLYSFD